jgi:hypothetical protein
LPHRQLARRSEPLSVMFLFPYLQKGNIFLYIVFLLIIA